MQETTIDVQGLYENHQYLFRVAGVNENGVGDFLQAENPITAKMPFGRNLSVSMSLVLYEVELQLGLLSLTKYFVARNISICFENMMLCHRASSI